MLKNYIARSLFFKIAVMSVVSSDAYQLPETQKAVVRCEISLDKIKSSKLAEMLEFQSLLEDTAEITEGAFDPTKITRVFGAFGAPENLDQANQLGAGDLTIDFLVRLQFEDTESVDGLMSIMAEQEPDTITRESKIYFVLPTSPNQQRTILFSKYDERTVEVGTEAYVFLSDENDLFSDGLQTQWPRIPDEAIKVAFDVKGAGRFIGEAIDAGQQSEDPSLQPLFAMVDKTDTFWMSADLHGDNLLTMEATSGDEEEASELAKSVNAILGMARMTGQFQFEQLDHQGESTDRVVDNVLSSLQAEVIGNHARLTVAKPHGFEEAVHDLYESVGAAGFMRIASASRDGLHDEEFTRGVIERLEAEGLLDDFEARIARDSLSLNDRLGIRMIERAVSGFDLKCDVTVKTDAPGATIRYQLITSSEEQRFDGVSTCEASIPMGIYSLWTERDGAATSEKDTFRFTKEEHTVTVTEKD